MSRCFPYPPPGYTVIRRSNEALIETIKSSVLNCYHGAVKLKKESEPQQPKEDRKKDKKDKKDKKREKKDKKRKEKKEKSTKQKIGENENQNLERSNLTEEHEKPVARQNPSSSSDSTENSLKRKRHCQSPAIVKQDELATRGNGNVLRLRLTSQKSKELDASVTQELVASCSTSGRVDPLPEHKPQVVPVVVQENFYPPQSGIPNIMGQVRPPRPDKELVCSTSGRTESIIKEDKRTAPGINIPKPEKKVKLSKGEIQYKNLIENWIPPPLQVDGDDDWLLPKKNPLDHVEKKLKTVNHVSSSSCCGSSNNLWYPRAQYLPEADIYALPFTVPF